MFGEVERPGLESGRLGELVEGCGCAGQVDGVAGESGELGEQALVAVRGVAGARALGVGFALGGGRPGGLGDRIWVEGWGLVFEEHRRPGVAEMPGEVVGEHAEEHVRADAVVEAVMDRADLQLGAFEGAKRALDLFEILVGAHDLTGVRARCPRTLVRST